MMVLIAITNADSHEKQGSFELGSVLAINDARQWGVLPDFEVSILARISYLYASQSIRLERDEFLAGFKSGFQAWVDGLA